MQGWPLALTHLCKYTFAQMQAPVRAEAAELNAGSQRLEMAVLPVRHDPGDTLHVVGIGHDASDALARPPPCSMASVGGCWRAMVQVRLQDYMPVVPGTGSAVGGVLDRLCGTSEGGNVGRGRGSS